MKKGLLFVLLLAGVANAQEGYEVISLIARGSYIATTAFSVGTAANVAIMPASKKRVDITCRNNSSFTVYIGTNAATTTLTGIGFPILANETFQVGAMTDGLYAIASGGTADVRCFEGAIR